MLNKFRSCLFISLFLTSFSAFANLPYYPIQFPRDEAAHTDNTPYPMGNMMEWWYYNGTLTSKTGRHLGYYLSFNYVQRLVNGTKVAEPVFEIQVTDIDKQKVYANQIYFADKDVSMSSQNLDVAFGKNLTLRKDHDTYFLDVAYQSVEGEAVTMSIRFVPTREALLIGKTGLVDMWDDTNSYYYSFTHVKSEGYVKIDNEVLEIDPQNSLSWMDHQWGDFIILNGYNQWMWTSIQLTNGMEINLGRIIDPKTQTVVNATANIVMPDGSHQYFLHPEEFSCVPNPGLLGQRHPYSYDVEIPGVGLKLTLTALAPNQDANGIWEGVSSAEGTYQNGAVSGQAYTENTVVAPG